MRLHQHGQFSTADVRKRLCAGVFAVMVTLPYSAGTGAFDEGWESSTIGTYTPDTELPFIFADEGNWIIGDTVSECDLTTHNVEIFSEGSGDKALRLTSEDNNTGCSDNVWIELVEIPVIDYNPGFSIPLSESTSLLFESYGNLVNPQSDSHDCSFRPCGDTISLIFIDNNENALAYILHRADDATPNESYFTYREIFLDASGSYTRNLFDDFSSIPGFIPGGAKIVSILFEIDEHGTAVLDNIEISEPEAPGDRDNDGVPDSRDNCPDKANKSQRNQDGDGRGNACDDDDDNDGMPDSYEKSKGFNPLKAADASKDADGDGHSNLKEYRFGSNPLNPKSKPASKKKKQPVNMPWLLPLME
jgi:hypothetical protein